MLCGFALTIPFELILEILFGIETQLKPFRVFSILAVLFFGVKVLFKGFRQLNFLDDLPLYGIFLYGVLISLWRMPDPFFKKSLFDNDLTQITLYLLTFFVIKNASLTRENIIRIFWFLTVGVLINCFYLFNSFFFLGIYGRQGGFMDNPNYVSLSIVVAIGFLLYRIPDQSGFFKRISYFGLILFLLFVFPTTGSRMGLVLLLAIGGLTFLFAKFRTKIMTVAIMAMLSFYFINLNFEKFNLGTSFVLTNRIANKADKVDVRFPIWKGAIKAGEEVWFTGIGIGQFKAKFSKLFQNEYHDLILRIVDRGAFLSTHSDYVTLLVVYGFVGLLLYVFYLFQSSKKLLLKIRFSDSPEERRFYQFSLIVLVTVALFGFAAENFLSPLYWILLALSTAWISVSKKSESSL